MEMEIRCLTRTGPGIKNCFCFNGIYRGCLINFKKMRSMHFIINFEISLVYFLNVLNFLLLASEKKGGYTFLICYFFSD